MDVWYDGTKLPEIPAELKEKGPYFVLLKVSDGICMIACAKKLWYEVVSGTTRLNQNNGSCSRCYINTDHTAWKTIGSGNWYWPFVEILWCNYDIPDGSYSATAVYKARGNDPASFGGSRVYYAANSEGTQFDYTVYALENSMVYANVLCRSEFTPPSGWTVLHESQSAVSSTGTTQKHIILYKKITESGIITFHAEQDAPRLLHIHLLDIVDCLRLVYHGDEYIGNTETSVDTVTRERPNYKNILWTVSSIYWSNSTSSYNWSVDGGCESIFTEEIGPRLLTVYDTNETETRTFTGHGLRCIIVNAVEVIYENRQYYEDGIAEFDVPEVKRIYNYETSSISWEAETPEGTSLALYAKVDDGEYVLCENGDTIPVLEDGENYTESDLTIKAELHTDDPSITPVLKSVTIGMKTYEDANTVTLIFASGNKNSIQNAAGPVTVSYQGGRLAGIGGPVQSFEESFTPTGLTDKSDRADIEHIEVEVTAQGTLTEIFYSDYTSGDEHIEVGVSAVGVLTHIDDL